MSFNDLLKPCDRPWCRQPVCIKAREQLVGNLYHPLRDIQPPVPYRPNQPDNLDGSEFRYKHDDPRASWNQPNAKFPLPASPRTLRPNAVPIKTWGELTNEDWIKLTSSQLASKWDAEARAQHELNNKSLVFRRVRDGATAVAVPLTEQRVREIVREELNKFIDIKFAQKPA